MYLLERIGTSGSCRTAPMRQSSRRHKLISVTAVVGTPVSGVIAGGWPVVIRRRVTVIIVGRVRRRVIRGWIVITVVIRSHVRPLCTSAQKSCNDACAKDRQQQCSTATLGFHCRFHQIFPFSNSEFPFFCGKAAHATLS